MARKSCTSLYDTRTLSDEKLTSSTGFFGRISARPDTFCDCAKLVSSTLTLIGSMIERAVSSSAESEHEKT